MEGPILIILAILAGVMFLKTDGAWGAIDSSEFSETKRFWEVVSLMETDGFQSPLYMNANNLFGMKMPAKRKTTAIGPTESGFARYASKGDSVVDIVLYMREWNYPTRFVSLRQLVDFMGSKGYYGSETSDSYYGKCEATARKYGLLNTNV